MKYMAGDVPSRNERKSWENRECAKSNHKRAVARIQGEGMKSTRGELGALKN